FNLSSNILLLHFFLWEWSIASIERVKISNVSANVVHNCEQHMKNNPFEDKKPCIVL
uniref:G protein gamma domain-containing protein n=1 Tax=Callorhinchus milii TaxID=7868 RepID=A0A4W3HR17_CALMI